RCHRAVWLHPATAGPPQVLPLRGAKAEVGVTHGTFAHPAGAARCARHSGVWTRSCALPALHAAAMLALAAGARPAHPADPACLVVRNSASVPAANQS